MGPWLIDSQNLRRKDSHSPNVDGSEHEEEFIPKVIHKVGGNFGYYEVCRAVVSKYVHG
jgi:hypothetical protein